MGDPGQLASLAGSIAGVCFQPNFMDRWGRPGGLYEQRLGRGWRARFLGPGHFRAAGIALAYGTDGMPGRLWPALAAAIDGALFGAQADRPESALAAASGDAAALMGAAGRWGGVAPGREADFCLFSKDPVADDFKEEPESDLTVLAGRPTWVHPRWRGGRS
jgi:hypothetical protein